MKVAVVRARMKAMTQRLERELSLLDRTFPRVDLAENFGDSCEAIRNLATAVKYTSSFAAMSDEGIQREIDAYGPALPSTHHHTPGE